MSKDLAKFLTVCIKHNFSSNSCGIFLSDKECDELEKAFIADKYSWIELFIKVKLIIAIKDKDDKK